MSQLPGCLNLRGQATLGVTRATSIDHALVFATACKRRHAIEVSRQDDLRSVERRDQIETTVIDRLLADVVSGSSQVICQPRADLGLAAGCGIDIDQRPRQRDDV